MGSQIEIAPVRDAFQFAVFAGIQKRKRIFHIRRAHRIVRKLIGRVVAENQILAGDAQVDVPLIPPVPPVFVPLAGFIGMAEELHFHLLELAGAKREVPRRDFVAKTLADLGDAERNFHPAAVQHVLEIHEHALSGFRPQKRGAFFFRRKRPDARF